jgi:dTDP-4-amino-4,6-dideoxygalactose transaminase
MTEVAAAIGMQQLKKIDGFNSKRVRNANLLSEVLEGLTGIQLPAVRPSSEHVFHQYTILVAEDRNEFAQELAKLNIQSATYYPIPVHKLPAFRVDANLPISETLASTCLSLPVHPSLSEAKIRTVAMAVRKVLGF